MWSTYGKADGLKYTNGYKSSSESATNGSSAALTLQPLGYVFQRRAVSQYTRSVVDGDKKWFLTGVLPALQIPDIMTEDVSRSSIADGRNLYSII
jgi:hypothetical protein